MMLGVKVKMLFINIIIYGCEIKVDMRFPGGSHHEIVLK